MNHSESHYPQMAKTRTASLPSSGRLTIQEVTKDPIRTSREPQASLASVKVRVHDSIIRNRLGRNGIHGRKPLLSKRNVKADLSFPENIVMMPRTYGEILWTDES